MSSVQQLKPILETWYVLGIKPGMTAMEVVGATSDHDTAAATVKELIPAGYCRVCICKVVQEVYAGA